MVWLKFLQIQHSNRKDLIGQSAGGCGFWTLTPSCEGISFHMFSDDERETERKKEYLKKIFLENVGSRKFSPYNKQAWLGNIPKRAKQ